MYVDVHFPIGLRQTHEVKSGKLKIVAWTQGGAARFPFNKLNVTCIYMLARVIDTCIFCSCTFISKDSACFQRKH